MWTLCCSATYTSNKVVSGSVATVAKIAHVTNETMLVLWFMLLKRLTW